MWTKDAVSRAPLTVYYTAPSSAYPMLAVILDDSGLTPRWSVEYDHLIEPGETVGQVEEVMGL